MEAMTWISGVQAGKVLGCNHAYLAMKEALLGRIRWRRGLGQSVLFCREDCERLARETARPQHIVNRRASAATA